MWKSLKKSSDTQSKWYFLFSKHGFVSFLIKYISKQYIILVFMILSALLIWFLSTETLVNVSCVFFLCFFLFCFFVFFCCCFLFLFCFFVFLLENHKATFKLNSIIHGFANKVRQSYRGEFNFV